MSVEDDQLMSQESFAVAKAVFTMASAIELLEELNAKVYGHSLVTAELGELETCAAKLNQMLLGLHEQRLP